ncbi:MAG: hypothetical protein B7Z04_14570 [Rhodobacterales bacterium 32-66-9]|nr:MAG: hypothetical protein B7Z04_14570 [Rhodobacterales bacterium 32-66-9]
MRPTDCCALRPGRQRAEGSKPRSARYLIFALNGGGVAAEPEVCVRLPVVPLQAKPVPKPDGVLQDVAAMCRRTTLACLPAGRVRG